MYNFCFIFSVRILNFCFKIFFYNNVWGKKYLIFSVLYYCCFSIIMYGNHIVRYRLIIIINHKNNVKVIKKKNKIVIIGRARIQHSIILLFTCRRHIWCMQKKKRSATMLSHHNYQNHHLSLNMCFTWCTCT